jgi:hypothetical protein
MNVCGACGLDFSSVQAFDRHRVGKHAYTFTEGLNMNPPREDGRRCLDVEELEALQFAQDARGRWGSVEHREAARRAFRKSPT